MRRSEVLIKGIGESAPGINAAWKITEAQLLAHDINPQGLDKRVLNLHNAFAVSHSLEQLGFAIDAFGMTRILPEWFEDTKLIEELGTVMTTKHPALKGYYESIGYRNVGEGIVSTVQSAMWSGACMMEQDLSNGERMENSQKAAMISSIDRLKLATAAIEIQKRRQHSGPQIVYAHH